MPKTRVSVKQTDLPRLKLRGPLTLAGDGLVYLEIRPDLDVANVAITGKPDSVIRGLVSGFSMPIYPGKDEELYINCCLPDRWDEASNIRAHIDCYLAEAEDDHAFRFQLSWERVRTIDNQVIPDTSQDVEVETETGVGAAQYKSFRVVFNIPYDTVDHELQADDLLNLRLRRIEKTGPKNECTGEIVVMHLGLIYQRNKLGVQV